MKKILQIVILSVCFFTQIQAQTAKLNFEEKAVIDIGKEYFDQENKGWLYLPKKQQILIYGNDSSKFVSLETGKIIKEIPPVKTKPLEFIGQLSPNEDKAVFYKFYGKESELWDIGSGKLIAVLPKQKDYIDGIEWSADSSFFMYSKNSFSPEKENPVFDAATGNIKSIIKTKYKAIAKFSPLGKTILTSESHVSARRNNLLKLWNAEDASLIKEFTFDNKHQFIFGEFTPDGKYIFARESQEFSIIDIETGKIKYSFTGIGHKFSPNGNSIAVYKEDFRGVTKNDETYFEIYDLETGKSFKEIKTGKLDKHQVETHQIIWTPDGKSLVSAGERYSDIYEAEVWHVSDGKSKFVLTPLAAKRSRDFFEGGYDYYEKVLFSSNSKYLITRNSTSKEDTLRFWNSETGELLQVFTGESRTLFLTSDNQYFMRLNRRNSRLTFYKIQ